MNLLTNLAAHFSLDALPAVDAHGNVADLNQVGTVQLSTGVLQNAAKFAHNGTLFAYQATGEAGKLAMRTYDLCINFWVKKTDSWTPYNQPAIAMGTMHSGTSRPGYVIRAKRVPYSLQLTPVWDIGINHTSFPAGEIWAVPDELLTPPEWPGYDTWMMVTGIWDRDGYMSLYINGNYSPVASIDISAYAALDINGTEVGGNDDWTVAGSYRNTNLFGGEIDNISVWRATNWTLNAADLEYLYNDGNGRDYSELDYDTGTVINTAPYIFVEAQDFLAERDPEREHGVIVYEAPKVELYVPEHYVEIGREICLPTAGFTLPSYLLCAVMGKDQVCEGEGGIARVVWCTNHPADSKVYASLIGPTGPWELVYTSTNNTYCHDAEFDVLGLDIKHYFYVESTSSLTGQTLTGSGIFCSGTQLTKKAGGLDVAFTLSRPSIRTISIAGALFDGAPKYPDLEKSVTQWDMALTITKYVTGTPGVGEEQRTDIVITPITESNMTASIKDMTITP